MSIVSEFDMIFAVILFYNCRSIIVVDEKQINDTFFILFKTVKVIITVKLVKNTPIINVHT